MRETAASASPAPAAGRPPPSPWLLRRATEAAARAVHRRLGAGEAARHAAATAALREVLDRLPLRGRVVAGEEAGRLVGAGADPPVFDLVLDPLEGITYLGPGPSNAMAALALAPAGRLFDPGPCHYLEKFVAPAAAEGAIEPGMPLVEKLHRLAERLGGRPQDLTVCVLEKPRHEPLIAKIERLGARTVLCPAGDLAGAVAAALPGSGIDALAGTGGAVEGLIAACAVRALGGVFFARPDPLLAGEKARVREAGLDTGRWYGIEELVAARETVFCATGITSGLLLEGVVREGDRLRTTTLMISGTDGERHLLVTSAPDDHRTGEDSGR